jgi:hypothetical protein
MPECKLQIAIGFLFVGYFFAPQGEKITYIKEGKYHAAAGSYRVCVRPK